MARQAVQTIGKSHGVSVLQWRGGGVLIDSDTDSARENFCFWRCSIQPEDRWEHWARSCTLLGACAGRLWEEAKHILSDSHDFAPPFVCIPDCLVS